MNYEHTCEGPRDPRITLVLRGGGACGPYQAGVYQALAERGLLPDRIVGDAIGALTAAVLCGNPPATRLARLEDLWRTLSRTGYWGGRRMPKDVHQIFGFWYTMGAMLSGRPELVLPFVSTLPCDSGARTLTPLRTTLRHLVDFNLVNNGTVRLTLGALNVIDRQWVYCDNARRIIHPEHVMTSAAVPPVFSTLSPNAVSNGYEASQSAWEAAIAPGLLGKRRDVERLCVVVDLWSPDSGASADLALGRSTAPVRTVPEVIHLVYPDRDWERAARDVDFSWNTFATHWTRGYEDAGSALDRARWTELVAADPGYPHLNHRPWQQQAIS